MLAPLLLAFQQPATFNLTASDTSLKVTQLLAISSVGVSARVAFTVDPIQKQIVEGTWREPYAGEEVASAQGEQKKWAITDANKNGGFTGDAFDGGYSFCRIESDGNRTMLLNAPGDSMVYVNGVPRAGDPYGYGYVVLPIELRQGENALLFSNGRGSLSVNLTAPKAEAQMNMGDLTLPDAVVGLKTNDRFGGVVVINSTDQPKRDLEVAAHFEGADIKTTRVPEIQPHSVLKLRFDIPQLDWAKPQEVDLDLALREHGRTLDEEITKFRVRGPQQTRKETYISPVDDSVQYYAVVPPPDPHKGMAMLLSLHGAGVEAIGQADAYSPKDWAYVACATNRRPYGFDWEDWGREDGLDVLRIASKEYGTDPTHTDVTGHSMGGHGTWQFGALFPDKWGAIGVSAGWASFYSYVGTPLLKDPPPMIDIFQRSAATSNTMNLLHNYSDEGVYILHGGADDNVPVSEARNMKADLAKIGVTAAYHEQPGVGHWWSTPLTKGASCLEWPEMMDFLRSHTDTDPATVDFTTVDLAVSPEFHGIRILQQQKELEPSRIQIDKNGRVDTDNIIRFYLPTRYNKPSIQIDDDETSSPYGYFGLINGHWQQCDPTPILQTGPFKEAINNHAVLVYGTRGTPEEREWAFSMARYDSESFWYRGNGSLKVISDEEYVHSPRSYGDAILFGNASENAAWDDALGGAPIRVENGFVQVGDRKLTGDNLGCMFCWRKPGEQRLNAAICGCGIAGDRLMERVPLFVSGVGIPDWLVGSPDSLSKGLNGVLGAGFFGPDGAVESGDQAWNKN